MKAPRTDYYRGCSKIFLALLFGAFLGRHHKLTLQSRSWGWIWGSGTPLLAKRPGAQRRHFAKINAEAEFEMFIFRLQAIHPVTPLRSSESPPCLYQMINETQIVFSPDGCCSHQG